MGVITTRDGVDIFYKDWGSGRPIVFHHGWPLSSDDWDAQMLYFLDKGYRFVAHDRRGHGRSSQVWNGHDMDHYASDVNAVVEHLDLHHIARTQVIAALGGSRGGDTAGNAARHKGDRRDTRKGGNEDPEQGSEHQAHPLGNDYDQG